MHALSDCRVSEWEHRYRVRESKPEDLEAIRQLRLLTEQQKQKMKDLIVSPCQTTHRGRLLLVLSLMSQAEKRVYQLELVNREKNYNQIFNANPCVGVLNPLNSKVCEFSCAKESKNMVIVCHCSERATTVSRVPPRW